MSAATRPSHPPRTPLRRLVDASWHRAAFADPPTYAGPDPDRAEITGVTLDSRSVGPGDLYAALPGSRVHGASYVAGAVRAGAVAVLTDPAGLEIIGTPTVPVVVVPDPRAVLGYLAAQAYGRPAETLRLVGITGTNGKTTTAYLLDAALRATGVTTGLIGTIETRIGSDRIPSERTTPESPQVHALFAVMVERGVEVAIMEVSSHALALHRIDGARYEVAVFTNLSQDHLDFHAGMEDYFAAKASLFTPERCEQAVVVTEDGWGARLAEQARQSGVAVVTVAGSDTVPARLDPEETGSDPAGPDWVFTPSDRDPLEFTLTGPGGAVLEVRSGLPGRHNLLNTAVAGLVMLALGYDEASLPQALSGDPRVPGRFETVDLGPDAPLAVVDFAHTPDAITATLAALRGTLRPGSAPAPDSASVPESGPEPGPESGPEKDPEKDPERGTSGGGGRNAAAASARRPLVAVLGAGGGRDASKRPLMGAAAARLADVVIVTDDNPRDEDPAAIRAAVLAGARQAAWPDASGGTSRVRVQEIPDRTAALARALHLATPAGVVAVLGKGHEQGQEIAGVVHPYDDREAVRAAYRRLTGPRAAESGEGRVP